MSTACKNLDRDLTFDSICIVEMQTGHMLYLRLQQRFVHLNGPRTTHQATVTTPMSAWCVGCCLRNVGGASNGCKKDCWMTTVTEPKNFISLAWRVAVSSPSFTRPLRHRLIRQPLAAPAHSKSLQYSTHKYCFSQWKVIFFVFAVMYVLGTQR